MEISKQQNRFSTQKKKERRTYNIENKFKNSNDYSIVYELTLKSNLFNSLLQLSNILFVTSVYTCFI